ncbi:MAG: RagB/SusD family nutrient uptake outer membrane protein, partial [Bacteroidetes bacterium]|nr:RagB/SusD family nutrient uptake outer membrane protein [Bacteroidota bacterium]
MVSSCKKSFLEVTPKGKLIAQTTPDYDLLLNNSTLVSVGGAYAHVFMADEVAAVQPYLDASEPRDQRLFNWSATVYEPQEDAAETQTFLQQVYTYNKIINEVPDATGGSDTQKKSIRAEAMAGRAWVYFMLVNYFGKPYNTGTSSTDPGFPIIKAADVTATKFTRASVKEVYDFIVNDLVTAIPDLPAQTTFRIRMSKGAGEALLGKVYMFMGNFTDALPMLNNALTHIQGSAIAIQLSDYNSTLGPGGAWLPLSIFGPGTPVIADDPETIYGRNFSNFWITNSALVLSPQTVALFKSSDMRLNFYSNAPFPAGTPYPAGMLRRTGPLTTSYAVTLPDVLLLRAECKARLNDLTGAVTDVETLRSKRMPAADVPVPSANRSNQKLLVSYILEERIREFASQGVRWFDMRRLSVDPLFGLSGVTHRIYQQDGSFTNVNMPAERL